MPTTHAEDRIIPQCLAPPSHLDGPSSCTYSKEYDSTCLTHKRANATYEE